MAGPVGAQEGDARPSFVNVVQVSGYLDPVLADFLGDAIAESEQGGAEALVIQLDSPGSVLPTAELDALEFWVGGPRGPPPLLRATPAELRRVSERRIRVTSIPARSPRLARACLLCIRSWQLGRSVARSTRSSTWDG